MPAPVAAKAKGGTARMWCTGVDSVNERTLTPGRGAGSTGSRAGQPAVPTTPRSATSRAL